MAAAIDSRCRLPDENGRTRLGLHAGAFSIHRLLEPVFDENADGMKAIAPADFLAAGAAAGIEVDGALDNPAPLAHQLRRDFRFDVETVRLEVEAARHRRPHHL